MRLKDSDCEFLVWWISLGRNLRCLLSQIRVCPTTTRSAIGR